jgi:hypothetical protein
MGVAEIEAFLAHLAQERHVAASTQNRVLSALLFLYKILLTARSCRAFQYGSCLAIKAPAYGAYT